MNKGSLVSVGEVLGYEEYQGIKGIVSHYNRGLNAFLVSLDKPIDGSYSFIFKKEELVFLS